LRRVGTRTRSPSPADAPAPAAGPEHPLGAGGAAEDKDRQSSGATPDTTDANLAENLAVARSYAEAGTLAAGFVHLRGFWHTFRERSCWLSPAGAARVM
jgi:hypothetical protein